METITKEFYFRVIILTLAGVILLCIFNIAILSDVEITKLFVNYSVALIGMVIAAVIIIAITKDFIF